MAEYNIYCTGSAFSVSEMTGNVFINVYLRKQSQGKYLCKLVQDILPEEINPHKVRDEKLLTLMRSDLAIFLFEGSDYDSDTMADFIQAKNFDIPSVILRSDFRDSNADCFYPRTEVIQMNSKKLYSEAMNAENNVKSVLDNLYAKTAQALIPALDKLLEAPSTLKKNHLSPEQFYESALTLVGIDRKNIPDNFIADLIQAKRDKNLL